MDSNKSLIILNRAYWQIAFRWILMKFSWEETGWYYKIIHQDYVQENSWNRKKADIIINFDHYKIITVLHHPKCLILLIDLNSIWKIDKSLWLIHQIKI